MRGDDAARSSGPEVADTAPFGPSADTPTGARTGAADRLDGSALVAGLKRGDPQAFEQFVKEQHGRMSSLASRFLGSEEEARDCVQDACLTVVRKIDGFRGDSQLSTWVHRIVVNTALARLRSREREHLVADSEEHLPQFDEHGYLIWPAGDDVRSLDDLMASEQIESKVRSAIDTLPADYRSIVLLRDLFGYSTRESAEILDITPSAAKVRLHRARSVLKSLLRPLMLGSDQ